MTEKKTTSFNFEESLQELESIVKNMEEGNLNLEESLKYFEKGITLTRQCQAALKEAEQKVQILTGNSVGATLQTYEAAVDNKVKDNEDSESIPF